jgi:hypothetical protein
MAASRGGGQSRGGDLGWLCRASRRGVQRGIQFRSQVLILVPVTCLPVTGQLAGRPAVRARAWRA